jgi:hypothetical protein
MREREAAHKLISSLEGRGHSEASVLAFLQQPLDGCERITAGVPATTISQTFRSARQKREERISQNEVAALTALLHWPHGGRSVGELRVLMALYGHSAKMGLLPGTAFTMSDRQLSTAAGVGGVAGGADASTAWRAAHGLARRGLLSRTSAKSIDTMDRHTSVTYTLLSPDALALALAAERTSNTKSIEVVADHRSGFPLLCSRNRISLDPPIGVG